MFCQYCLSSESTTLFQMRTNCFIVDNQQINYTDALKFCTNIKIEDEQTAKICPSCMTKLTLEYTSKYVKTEPTNILRSSGFVREVKQEPALSIDSSGIVKEEATSTQQCVIEHVKTEVARYQIIFPEPAIKAEPELIIETSLIDSDIKKSVSKKLTPTISTNNKSHKCQFCIAVLSSKRGLRYHFKRIHATKKFECHHCSALFSAKHQVKRHLGYHFDKKYSCTQCSNVFRSADKLARHINMWSHYECEQCSVIVKSGVQVKCEHRSFQCHHCSSVFKSKFHVLRHVLRHFEQRYKCSKCGQGKKHKCTADGPTGLVTRHLRGTHALKKFQCQHCAVGFDSKLKLTQHVLRHFEDEFGCSKCKKRYKSREKLTEHILHNHTDSKPFQCKDCPRVFKFNRYLSKHIKNMHTVKKK